MSCDDRAFSDSPEAVLCRLRVNGETYRVVFGDLSQRDVTPAELARLEASL